MFLSSHTDAVDTTDSVNWRSYSLFESLRELIYSEVASLISQNEMQPHYLVELFRRLQLVRTDYQRRQVMATVEHVVADYLTDSDEQPSSALVRHAGLQRSVSYSVYYAVQLITDCYQFCLSRTHRFSL